MALRVVIAVLIIGLGGFYAGTITAGRVNPEVIPTLSDLPSQLGAWSSQDFPLSDEVTSVLAADATLQRVYYHPQGPQVSLFLAYFAEQAVNSQIHSPRNCVPGNGWQVVSLQKEILSLSRGSLTASQMSMRRNEVGMDMLYWFQTRGGVLSDEFALKWDLIRNSLTRRPTDAMFIRFTTDQRDVDIMRDFIHELDPHLNTLLAQTGL